MGWRWADQPATALPDPAGQAGGPLPRLRAAVLLALTLVLWGSLLTFPTFVAGDSLDQSWAQCLGYFLRHGRQAGTDYVFTYGPLGTFMTAPYDPGLFWPKYAWELGLGLLTALAALEVARHLPHVALPAAFLGLAIAFLPSHPDAVYNFLVLALGLVPFLRRRRLTLTYLVPCALVLALLGLVKTTLLLLALGTVAAFTLDFLLARRWPWAPVPGALFALCFVLAWALLGQSPGHLPAYLVWAWHITAGYGEAMACEAGARGGFLALATLLPLAAAVLLQARTLRRNPHALVATALVGGFVFVAWKYAFVRHDPTHAPMFFAFALLVPFLLAALVPAPDHPGLWAALLGGSVAAGLLAQDYWPGLFLSALLLAAPFALRRAVPRRHGLVAAAVLLALFVQVAVDGGRHLWRTWVRFGDNAAVALTPQALRRGLEARREAQREAWALPRTRAAVGGAPVDIFSSSQGVLLLNDLNYRPRPVFQSYSAYTGYLAGLNARTYRGDTAPEYVLLRPGAIDRHPVPAEDGPALLEVLRRYHPVLVEKGMVLLRRSGAAPGDPAGETVVERTVRAGEEVRLDDLPGKTQAVSLKFEPTWLGRVQLFVCKPAELWMRVRLEDGKGEGAERLFRLVPGMVGEEFLLNPLLEDGDDLLGLYRGAPGKRVRSLCILPPASAWASYRPEVRLRVRGLDGFPCREGDVPPAGRKTDEAGVPSDAVSRRGGSPPAGRPR